MDVVEQPANTVVEIPRKQQLIRRPIHVHEGVIARLETCERKKDSIRGSGLHYVLNALNSHCHHLPPSKLLDALRIISDNQLFDRRVLYNLFDSIAKNLLYFTSTQHRTLIECISKCMAYTLQNGKSIPLSKCDEVAWTLGAVLPSSSASCGNEIQAELTNQDNTSYLHPVHTYCSERVISMDVVNDNSIGIEHFDGSPVPLAELNRLQVDILKSVLMRNRRMRGANYANEGIEHDMVVEVSCLENLLRQSCSVYTPSSELIKSCKVVINMLSKAVSERDTGLWKAPCFANTLQRCAVAVSDTIVLALTDKLPAISHDLPLRIHREGDYKHVSSTIKMSLLQSTDAIRAAYINGDVMLFRMIIDELYSSVCDTASQHCGIIGVATQNVISELKDLNGQLKQQDGNFESHLQRDVDEFIRFKFKQMMLDKILSLFDTNGLLIQNMEKAKIMVNDYTKQHIDSLLQHGEGCYNSLSAKSACLLLCMVTEGYPHDAIVPTDVIRRLMLTCFQYMYHKCYTLTNSDILCVIERCYHCLGYIHHYAARVMLNQAFSRYIVSRLDALVAANLHALCLTIPYNMVGAIDFGSTQRVLAYLSEDKSVYQPFVKMLSKFPDKVMKNNAVRLHGNIRILAPKEVERVASGMNHSIRNKTLHQHMEMCHASTYKTYKSKGCERPLQVLPFRDFTKIKGVSYIVDMWKLLLKTKLRHV